MIGEVAGRSTIYQGRTPLPPPNITEGGGWGDPFNGENWLAGSLFDGTDPAGSGPCIINCTNKTGRNLFDIMEEDIAAVLKYQFSQVLAAHKGEKWDPDKLNQWLWRPQSLIKGTKMTFAGMPKAEDRADVIAYLETLK